MESLFQNVKNVDETTAQGRQGRQDDKIVPELFRSHRCMIFYLSDRRLSNGPLGYRESPSVGCALAARALIMSS